MANPIIFGKYHLIDRISAGGMAEVFRAKSYGVAGFEKVIVIKKILPHLSKDDEFIAMFLDEARISVSLSHANLVQVIDLGKEGESYFMAMEYVNGQDLSRTILQGRKTEVIGVPRCLFIITEILKGLDYAHRRKDSNYQDLNIVHCDVSPQNILLSYEGEVKLTDFGISRAAFQSASSRGVVRGKYAYMSPEQVEGKELDRRSDVFSVGIILHELLAGKRLFKKDNVDKTLRAVLHGEVPSLSELNPEVDPELEYIVEKALVKNRDDRYADAAEMLDDLASYMFSRGIHTSQTDISKYLNRIFEKEVAARLDPIHVGDASMKPFKLPSGLDGESTPSPGANGPRVFIPAGSGHSILTYEHQGGADKPVLLSRINVVVLVLEWFGANGVKRLELERIERDIHAGFEDRIRSMHGDLWEVNHNSLVATWVIDEDPGGTVAECLECAMALRGEELEALGEGASGQYIHLVQAVHAGSVVVEREGGSPLSGWQLSRTFALPRTLVNRMAPDKHLIVTESVQELAGQCFSFQSIAAIGKSIHVPPLFELAGRHEPSGNTLRVPWSPVTRILGQGQRVRQLEAQLSALSSGIPLILLLKGEEGSGRGRSRQAITMAARKAGVPIFSCHGDKALKCVTYGAALDLVRNVAGLAPDESIQGEKQKLGRLAQLGLSPDTIGLLRSLFAEAPLPEGAQRRRPSQIRAAIDKMVSGLCRDQSAILIFEDVDQFDPLSLGVLKSLVGNLGRRRLAIVLIGKETMETAWLKNPAVKKLESESLSEDLIRLLVKDMLAVGEVAPSLVESLHSKGQGNPLWTKEMVAELADSGSIRVNGRVAELAVTRWPLPDTLEALLKRRLGWLPERLRKLLGRVAFLGRTFPLIGAQWLVGEGGSLPQRLQPALDVGILQEKQVKHAIYYRFSHTLYRSLAKDELGIQAKQDMPRVLKRLLDGHREYQRGWRLELLASALEGSLSVDEVDSAEAAGDKAKAEQGFSVALHWYQSALRASHSGARSRGLQDKMAQAFEGLGRYNDAEELLQSILKSAIKDADENDCAQAEKTLGQFMAGHGKALEASKYLSRALTRQKNLGSLTKEVELMQALGGVYLRLGRMDEAARLIRGAMQSAREVGDPLLIIRSANLIGYYSLRTGDTARAAKNYDRCFSAAQDVGSKELILEALKGKAVVHLHEGKPHDALRTFKEAMALAQELGDFSSQIYILSRIGALYGEEGNLRRGEHSLQLAFSRARALGNVDVRIHAAIHLGFIHVKKGAIKKGLLEMDKAIREAEDRSLGSLVTGGTFLQGKALLELGNAKVGQEKLQKAVQLGEKNRQQRIVRLALELLGADEPPTQC